MNIHELPDSLPSSRISTEDFQSFVADDPAWASKLTEPVAVIGETKFENSPISHLSPLLHFHRGYTLEGKGWTASENPHRGLTPRRPPHVASFLLCPNLTVATGTFYGSIEFHTCGIEIIDEEFVINIDPLDVRSASFVQCRNLKIARGHYPKQAAFRHCENLRRVQDLTLGKKELGPNPVQRLVFENCPKLEFIPQQFFGDTTVSLPKVFRLRAEKEEKARQFLKETKNDLQL